MVFPLETAPRRGITDVQWDRLLQLLHQSWDWQQHVQITGLLPSGDDVVLRFLASRATLFVRVHVQHTGTGGGGESYNRFTYVSDSRVDCRAARQQDVTIERDTGNDYIVWLIPEFLSGDTYIRFDGSNDEGDDLMAFMAIGPNTKKVNELINEAVNLNEKLERLLTHAKKLTGLDLDPGEK